MTLATAFLVAFAALSYADPSPQYPFGFDPRINDVAKPQEVTPGDDNGSSYSFTDPNGNRRTIRYTAEDLKRFNDLIRKRRPSPPRGEKDQEKNNTTKSAEEKPDEEHNDKKPEDDKSPEDKKPEEEDNFQFIPVPFYPPQPPQPYNPPYYPYPPYPYPNRNGPYRFRY